MQKSSRGLHFVVVASLALSLFLGSSRADQAPPAASKPVPQAAGTQILPDLRMELPKDSKVKTTDGVASIEIARCGCHVQVWSMAKAAPADVLPKIAETVKPQVKDFKAVDTKDMTLAGSPGKHVVATGVEADDGDPAKVEVFVFKAGDKTYLFLAHSGEEDPAESRDAIVGVINTAKAQ